MKRITTIFMAVAMVFLASSVNTTKAQKSQGEVAITGGVGYSLGISLIQGAVNTSLRAADLEELKATPIINGMVDYAVSDGFSLGAAYSYNGMSWTDEYSETDSLGNITTTQGTVKVQRQNIAMRGLFHFGADETVDMYAGARLGTSLWRVDATASNSNGDSASDFAAPAGVFSVQALFGVRKYFNDVIGVNFEVGVGTAPYFVAGGLSFKL